MLVSGWISVCMHVLRYLDLNSRMCSVLQINFLRGNKVYLNSSDKMISQHEQDVRWRVHHTKAGYSSMRLPFPHEAYMKMSTVPSAFPNFKVKYINDEVLSFIGCTGDSVAVK